MSPQFLVTDLDRSITFYTGTLGFEQEFCYEDFYTGIIKAGCSIHLKTGKPSKEERENKRAHNDLDIVFSVTDVDALYEQLVQASVDMVQPVCDQPYGWEFYIADPDGYILAFLQ